ncbi:MAG: 1-deoxy-D-xylulose-5-phosphate synthase [Candidatus Goldiibacteriota bacterium]
MKKTYKYLNSIKKPADILSLDQEALDLLASETRDFMVDVVSRNGGHLASSLGAVETCIALFKTFRPPEDKIIWDVGHQAYAHKILTGRKNRFKTLRKKNGISGFLKPSESKYDVFAAGHTSTSISSAMGIAKARDIAKQNFSVIAVIGDASLANGMSLEAINNIGHDKTDILIVVIDNEMSISPTVGAMSNYLNKIISGKFYTEFKTSTKKIIESIPKIGSPTASLIKHLEEAVRGVLSPGMIFEELGLYYYGPIDGHNIGVLTETLDNIKKIKGPKLLHVITRKGKGYKPAEENPTLFHGIGRFDKATGEIYKPVKKNPPYCCVFSDALLKNAEKDKKIAVIVAAMIEGTNLSAFRDKYPERFFDVGIAEEHAVTFAAGLAGGGLRPVVAIYSTFIQRSVDQIIHDVGMQKLPVIFALDRAGLVGEDGPTHHGVFDIVFMKMVPNMVVMAPSGGEELREMTAAALAYKDGPVSIRFPRGETWDPDTQESAAVIKIGKSKMIKKGNSLTIISLGALLQYAAAAAEKAEKELGISIEIIDARFAKPFDKTAFLRSASKTKKVIIIEEGAVEGGFGQAVAAEIAEELPGTRVKTHGIPDRFIEQGTMEQARSACMLTDKGIYRIIKDFMEEGQ